jgi:hypothetical protein
VNGAGPLATSLRALRHAPVLVDDVGIAPRLAAVAGDMLTADVPLDPAELVRWTRAWVVAWQGVLAARGVIGTLPPWTVPLAVADLPVLKGDPEGRRRTAALELLERSRVVALAPGGRTLSLDESAFVEHRSGIELQWDAICRAARFQPASLLVARALADLVGPPSDPAPVTLRELAERTGYAPKQVRVSLRRLVEARVLRTAESAGMATRYCFGTVATLEPVDTSPAPSIARTVAASPEPMPQAPASPSLAPRSVALRMTLNGVTITLGAGLSPHVELGPDGVPHVSFDG